MTRTRIGQAARRRVAAGGPRALGRAAAGVEGWAHSRERVLARAGWRCQACRLRRRLEVHHVIKRAQGGSDFDLDHLVALCRTCHEQTDWPYIKGRLIVIALGAEQFAFEVIQRRSKWDPPAPVCSTPATENASTSPIMGRQRDEP